LNFNHPQGSWRGDGAELSDPGDWKALVYVNWNREQNGLDHVPTDHELNEILRDHGFTDCFGIFYRPSRSMKEAVAM
jgi:hypothetical protein